MLLYRHLKPCGEVFYIGVGNKIRPYTKTDRSDFWWKVVNKYGYEIQILKTDLTKEEAYELEKILNNYEKMRDYGCVYYHLDKDNNLVKNNNISCWKGIDKSYTFSMHANINGKYQKIDLLKSKKDYIYITNYIQPEVTDQQRKRLLYLINKITSCKFIKIKNVVYIEYKMIEGYDNNLILLNFIRNLWCIGDKGFDYKGFFNSILNPKPRNQDVLIYIMNCFKNNIITPPNYQDHSNIICNIIPKTKDELLSYKGKSTKEFLQIKSKSL